MNSSEILSFYFGFQRNDFNFLAWNDQIKFLCNSRRKMVTVIFKCIFCAIKLKFSALISCSKHFPLLTVMGLRILNPIVLITQAVWLAYGIIWRDKNRYLWKHAFHTKSLFLKLSSSGKDALHLKVLSKWKGKREIPPISGLFICPWLALKHF